MLKIDKENENISLVRISIAVITNQYGKFTSIDKISSEAAKVKKVCKKIEASCFRTNDRHITK